MDVQQTWAVREAAAGGRPPLGLESLIAPVTVATFLSEYWEKAPLVVHRIDPDYFRGLLTLADIDAILATSGITDEGLRLVADGEETPISKLLPDNVEGKVNGLEALYARYRAGSTINLKFLHERWPALAALCRTLATELSAGIHGNVYLTPPNSRGLTPHHDTHDVFVLQLYGSKNWTLHPPQTTLPMYGHNYSLPPEGAGDPVLDFVLKPGDIAYLPRGTVHAARANEVASLHLTIGINPMVYGHLVRSAMEQVLAKDVRFRAALPVGYVHDERRQQAAADRAGELLGQLGEAVSAVKLVDEAVRRMLQRRPPSLAGHLLDLEAEPSITLDTPLRRRSDIEWRLSRTDEEVRLEFHGKTIDLPAFLEDELAFMIKADRFTGAEVPGTLDDAGRLVLIRQLVSEGFLTTT